MLTTTSEYALRAMVALGGGGADAVPSGQLARESGVPRKYLSKILSDLVRAGLLRAGRGPGGGFRLARAADAIRLFEICNPFEPAPSKPMCPLGQAVCNDTAPCGAHERWKVVRAAYDRFLLGTTLADLAPREKRVEAPRGRARSARKSKGLKS